MAARFAFLVPEPFISDCAGMQGRHNIFQWLFASLLACGCSLSHAAEPRRASVPDTIEERVAACSACHGKQGEGIRRKEYYPRLAGKPAVYLYNQLLNFRERRRQSPIMTYMVAYLSEPYLREIAEYYSRLDPPYGPPATSASREMLARGEALVTKGDASRNLPACVSCHGSALTGMEPAIPGLIGLSAEYLGAQLGAWRGRQRRAAEPDCMAQIAALLTPGDISAVAAWLTSRPTSGRNLPAPPASLKLPLHCGSVSQPNHAVR